HDEVARSGLLERTHYVDAALTPDSLDPERSIPLAPGRHDVLHAHFGPNARRFAFARQQAGAPLVVTFHGYDFSAQPTADVVSVNCEHARRALEALGCPREKLVRLRMPIVTDELPFRARHLWPGEPVRIVTVGRLGEKKEHHVPLRAIADAARDIPVRYDVVGGGPLARRLDALVRALGLEGVVALHGERDSASVRGLLDQAHLFVLASTEAADGDQEGAPVALMEAQACGLPVV